MRTLPLLAEENNSTATIPATWENLSVAGQHSLRYRGHQGAVLCLAWSPDGQFLTSAALDRTVQIWHAASGEACLSPCACLGRVLRVLWSHDSRFLVTIDEQSCLQVWALDPYLRMEQMPKIKGVCEAAFSADGSLLALGSPDGGVRVVRASGMGQWEDVSAFSLPPVVRCRAGGYHAHLAPNRVSALAFAPEGGELAAGGLDDTIALYAPLRGEEIWRRSGSPVRTVISLSWSPSGTRFASCSAGDRWVRCWDAASADVLANWPIPWAAREVHVRKVSWSPRGDTIACGTTDGTVRLWRCESDEIMQVYCAHACSVNDLAWSPDGRFLASAGGDGTVVVVEVPAC
jgi:WD40 repeat protein